jgi:hypothetical protein
MKGDFTRFTFRPEKRYTSVLMQQGRLQLDADWNEQMSIQTYLSQQQILDMIGSSGTPRLAQEEGSLEQRQSGFQIKLTPDKKDLLIQAGHFYLNGMLCELSTAKPISATVQSFQRDAGTTTLTAIVPNLVEEGQSFVLGQWLVINLSVGASEAEYPFQIRSIEPDQRLLTLVSTDPQLNFPTGGVPLNQPLKLRRLTTYKTQVDRPQAMTTDFPGGTLKKGTYLVYLDAWQRHITAIEDPEIREVALGVPDTTTRTQTISQIKLLFLGDIDPKLHPSREAQQKEQQKRLQEAWDKLSDRPVTLTARDASDLSSSAPPSGLSTGLNGLPGSVSNSTQPLENQLYRIEIHQSGKLTSESGSLTSATFKWSRENGSIANPIERILSKDNVIEIKPLGQDITQSFESGQWVEVIDEARELNNQPGTLVRLTDVSISGKSGKLTFDPATMTGEAAITPDNFPLDRKPKVRRWDWSTKDRGMPLTTANPDGWIELEKGIQIKFEVPKQHPETLFQTGDYWLIPARADQGILWPRDSQNKRKAEPPQGIQHQFAQLALVTVNEQGEFQPLLEEDDLRVVFPALMNCFDKSGDFISGSLGIGVKQPKARLHVQGDVAKAGQGLLSSTTNSTEVTISGGSVNQVHPGDLLVAIDANQQQRLVVAIADNGSSITVNRPFNPPLATVGFHYQQPVLRLDNSNQSPQLFLTAQNNLGVGTPAPDAKVTIQGTVNSKEAATSTATLHLKQANTTDKSSRSLFYVRNDGAIGIGTILPQSRMDLAGSLTVGSNLAGQQAAPLNGLLVEGDVGLGIMPTAAKLQVDGIVKIGSPDSYLQLQQDQPNQQAIFTASANLLRYHFDRNLEINLGNLSVTGTTDNATANGLQIKNRSGNTLFTVRNDGHVGIGVNAEEITSRLQIDGSLRIGKTDFVELKQQIKEQINQVEFLSSDSITRYQFDKSLEINSGNLSIKTTSSTKDSTGLLIKNALDNTLVVVRNDGHIGIGQDPSDDVRLQVNGALKLQQQADTIQITPTNQQVNFTSSDSVEHYEFDKQLRITQAGANIIGDVHIEQAGTTGGNLTIANTLTIDQGNLTLSAGIIKTKAQALSLQLESGQEMAIATGEVKIAGKLGVGTVGTLNSRLEVVGEANPTQIDVPVFQVNKSDNSSLLVVKNNGEITVGSSDSTGVSGNLKILGNKPNLSLLGTNASFNLGTNQQFFINTTETQTTLGTAENTKLVFQTKEISASGDWKINGSILQVSSRTLKNDIADLSTQEAKTILRGMTPVKFRYKADQDQQLRLGFIAEDLPTAVVSPDRRAVDLMEVITVLTKTVQDQQQALVALFKLVKEQQQAIADLKSHQSG